MRLLILQIAFVCIIACPVPIRAGEPKVEAFAPATSFAGTPRERGVTYGKQHRAAVRQFLDEQIYAPFDGKPATRAAMLVYAESCQQVVQEVCPVIADEIVGIAEGAGLESREVMLIHLHEEFYHRAKLPEKPGHCTAVAVSPADSGDGHAYIGQTWDWMTSVAGMSSVTIWHRTDGSVMGYGYPGIPFGAGMNSHGLALCWTSAALSRKDQSPRIGLPSYVLIAHLLMQKDLDGVVREARRDRHAGWFTMIVTDAGGNIVNIEGSPSGIAVEKTKTRLVRADYGTASMRKELTASVKAWKPPARVDSLTQLLNGTAGGNGRMRLQECLGNPELGIATPKKPRNMTIDVMLFDMTAQKAWFSRGPGFGIDWREFSIPDRK